MASDQVVVCQLKSIAKTPHSFKKGNVSVLPANLGSNSNYAQAMGANHSTPLGGRGGSDHNIFIRGGPIPRSTRLYTIFDRKGTHYWAGNNFMLLKSVEVLQ